MQTTGVLTVFEAAEVKFPSGEHVTEYITELSVPALDRLEFMTFEHESGAVTRYEEMHGKYLDGTAKRLLSAETFASDVYVQKFREEYHEAEELSKKDKMMSTKTAKAILQFLFVYYFSYHEAEEASGKEIKLESFSRWFGRLRVKLARQQARDLATRERNYGKLRGRRREAYLAKLKKRTDVWRKNWKEHGYTGSEEHMNAMKHVVIMADEDTVDVDWWKLFKVSTRMIERTTDGCDVRTDVLKKYRIWSRFVHPDRPNNRGLGLAFQHLLAQRFVLMTNKKNEMEKWFEEEEDHAKKLKKALKKEAERKKRINAKEEKHKRYLKKQEEMAKNPMKARRIFFESDSEPEIIEIL